MPRHLGHVYHLADAANLASIQAQGLMSTERLLQRVPMAPAERRAFLRAYRPMGVTFDDGVFVRDHKPMPPAALAKALPPSLTPADWYEFLNGFVFFWTDPDRLRRQRAACGPRSQYVLTLDGDLLVAAFPDAAFVSPINSGNARRKPSMRDRSTLMPYARWQMEGWPRGQRWRRPVEVLIRTIVPLSGSYVLDVKKITDAPP